MGTFIEWDNPVDVERYGCSIADDDEVVVVAAAAAEDDSSTSGGMVFSIYDFS